jgi:hypothetical protein
MPTTFDDVYLITPKQVLARSDEVDALEAWLGAELPSGYRQFVTTLGQGTYCGRLMVLMPSQIQAECESERAFVREYFDDFWGEGSSLSMHDAAQGVPFAATVDGDKIFYSIVRRQLFVLPRHGLHVLWMPQGLDDPLDWGLPVLEGAWRYFDSYIDRSIVELFSSGAFQLSDIAARICRRWPPAHRIDAAWGSRLFLPDLRGAAQLTQAPGDTRVGVRLEFDDAVAKHVAPFIADLTDEGFRVTASVRSQSAGS